MPLTLHGRTPHRPDSSHRAATRRRRFVTPVVVAALALGALTGVAAGPALAEPVTSPALAPVPVPPAPVFGACADPGLTSAGAQCAFVTVPKDYSDPSAGTIQLAISRISHTTANYQGIMLTNPGGPGGSGLTLSELKYYVPRGGGDFYDWIGFDPRGVGSSRPAVRCDPSLLGYDRPDYVATSTSLQNVWLARSSAYSKACAANSDLTLLRNMTTVDNAMDMESIRLALGQPQLNYYGFSYGTYLGQVYATLYPSRVRRAVFDSNVDPTRVFYDANLDQDQAFQTTSEAFFAWVAKYDDVYHLGATEQTVSAFYYGILDQLRRQPQAGGRIGPDEWNDVVVPAGYYQLTWTGVASLMAAAAQGDWGPTLEAYGHTSPAKDNGFGVYLATQCTDARWPDSYTRTWKPDALRYDAKYPFLTWNNVWFNAPCLTWPAPDKAPVTVDGQGVAPILLIDETLDAATPFQGSLTVRSLFPNSVLLALPGGTSHALSLFGDACEDNTIAAYLATGALPQRTAGAGPDKLCRPLPEPVPDAGSAASGEAAVAAAVAGSVVPAAGAPAVLTRILAGS